MPSGIQINVEYYVTPDGHAPFVEWMESIKDLNTQQRIRHRIERFELGNLGDYKPIKSARGLYEARLFFGPGYRLYFALENRRLILLLCGGEKTTQHRDLQRAKALLESYRSE